MVNKTPMKGDLFVLPQGVVVHKLDINSNNLFYFFYVKKPTLGIFLENFNDNYSKVLIEDSIGYVTNDSLYHVKQEYPSEFFKY
jgi:hypothetical protein